MDGWYGIVQGFVFFLIFAAGIRFVCCFIFGAAIGKNHIGVKIACVLFIVMCMGMLDRCNIDYDVPSREVTSTPEIAV